MKKAAAYGLFCFSIVFLFKTYNAGEFVKADIGQKKCADLVFTSLNVLSDIACAGKCQMNGNCTSFLYTGSDQRCDGCTSGTVNVTTQAETVLYTRCLGPCKENTSACDGEKVTSSEGRLDITDKMCKDHCQTKVENWEPRKLGQLCLCVHPDFVEHFLDPCHCEQLAECLGVKVYDFPDC